MKVAHRVYRSQSELLTGVADIKTSFFAVGLEGVCAMLEREPCLGFEMPGFVYHNE